MRIVELRHLCFDGLSSLNFLGRNGMAVLITAFSHTIHEIDSKKCLLPLDLHVGHTSAKTRQSIAAVAGPLISWCGMFPLFAFPNHLSQRSAKGCSAPFDDSHVRIRDRHVNSERSSCGLHHVDASFAIYQTCHIGSIMAVNDWVNIQIVSSLPEYFCHCFLTALYFIALQVKGCVTRLVLSRNALHFCKKTGFDVVVNTLAGLIQKAHRFGHGNPSLIAYWNRIGRSIDRPITSAFQYLLMRKQQKPVSATGPVNAFMTREVATLDAVQNSSLPNANDFRRFFDRNIAFFHRISSLCMFANSKRVSSQEG